MATRAVSRSYVSFRRITDSETDCIDTLFLADVFVVLVERLSDSDEAQCVRDIPTHEVEVAFEPYASYWSRSLFHENLLSCAVVILAGTPAVRATSSVNSPTHYACRGRRR